MFLQVMTDAGDIAGNFNTVGETNSCDLSERGVRLLRAGCRNLCAYASLLR
jgi:hypothetical protein